MEFNDVKEFIEANKENEEVQNYMQGLSKVTLDGAEEFIKSDEGKKWIAKHNDKFFTKGLETWKQNNLESLIESEVKKRFPDKDPKDIEIEKLKAKIEADAKEKLRSDLTTKALKVATEKKLPTDLIEYLIGNDEANTLQNIDKLEEVFNKHLQGAVEERLKSNSYVPPKSEVQKVDIGKLNPIQLLSLGYENQNK